MTAEVRLRELLEAGLEALMSEGTLPANGAPAVVVQRTAQPEHGDFATNVAMTMAKQAGMPPRQLAERLISAIPAADIIERSEVAGPGFINFFLSREWLHDLIHSIGQQREQYGRAKAAGPHVQIEFVSANPTGPLHVGSGRNAAYGDALARILEAAGCRVEREYYINDAGKQITRFTESVMARYKQALGREAEVPEDGYHGEYIVDLGRRLAEENGDKLVDDPGEVTPWALQEVITAHRATLARMSITFDRWFSELVLHEQGKVAEALGRIKEAGHVYEKEGALWFKATAQGAPRDQVLVRSDEAQTPTYLGVDIAYLIDKLGRGYDSVIYVWGADHHGNVAGLMAAARALGVENNVEILLHQMVNLMSEGAAERMSKRSGNVVALDDLLDEVGPDAARFTFLSRSIDQTIDFDLALLKAQSDENPVYYVQYQHARACSILKKAGEQGIEVQKGDLSVLDHPSEIALMKKLAAFPETVTEAAGMRAPHRLVHFAHSLAAGFSAFHRDCRVLGEDPTVSAARLELVDATRQVLANNMAMLGISSPERM
ncbi:MAG: arginine--tRNA ligase [Actinomycetota bacterium]